MKKRKPQPRCKCGHAKSSHYEPKRNLFLGSCGVNLKYFCTYCWDKCPEYKMDNLATLERLYAFKEEKNIKIVSM